MEEWHRNRSHPFVRLTYPVPRKESFQDGIQIIDLDNARAKCSQAARVLQGSHISILWQLETDRNLIFLV